MLCGAYFNLDWDLTGPTASAVLDVFVAENTSRDIREAREQAHALIAANLSEDELRVALGRFGLDDYDPTLEGLTYRGWLELVMAKTAAP